MNAKAEEILSLISDDQDMEKFRALHWTGTFREYLDLILEDPRIVRNAHQRIYDMIMSFGTEEFTQQKEKLVRYHFFSDPLGEGDEAIFGLERALMRLVGCFKSAAAGFGTEKRVLLLHGPVGSSKSTIVRLMKRGLEQYSHTDDGRLYTFQWRVMENGEETWVDCPMHAEPLLLVPEDTRKKVIARLNESFGGEYRLSVEGDLCPASRWYYQRALELHDGDWQSMIENEVRVRRLLLSERDRVGIGTFQPKDEKNQDSTELTGDINYRKIAEYGSDSDPRAFNFDGEFNIANRGVIEFIEVLKLDVAFLYDLLGASAGARDQAEEVRPDAHRRGDHRAHERARVSQAPEQRAHGGVPGPDGEDRRPVQRGARRRDPDLQAGLHARARRSDPHRAAHRSRRRPCGPC
jgi:serine protein kinase